LNRDKPAPVLTERAAAAKAAREAKLATALRANLRKRKTQDRARTPAATDRDQGGR